MLRRGKWPLGLVSPGLGGARVQVIRVVRACQSENRDRKGKKPTVASVQWLSRDLREAQTEARMEQPVVMEQQMINAKVIAACKDGDRDAFRRLRVPELAVAGGRVALGAGIAGLSARRLALAG